MCSFCKPCEKCRFFSGVEITSGNRIDFGFVSISITLFYALHIFGLRLLLVFFFRKKVKKKSKRRSSFQCVELCAFVWSCTVVSHIHGNWYWIYLLFRRNLNKNLTNWNKVTVVERVNNVQQFICAKINGEKFIAKIQNKKKELNSQHSVSPRVLQANKKKTEE